MELLFLITFSILTSVDTATIPGPRNAHSMVYHEGEQKVYLFGGASDKEVLDDLWTFDGNGWRQVEVPARPGPRVFAATVYDAGGDRILLFGGSRVLFGDKPDPAYMLGDTWQYKEGQWQQIMPDRSPTARAESSLVYDAGHNRFILFGGYFINNQGQYIKLNDTWAYYDEEWHLVSEQGPSPRHGVALWYDPVEECVMLAGGSTEDRQYGKKAGETWRWDGAQWELVLSGTDPGIFNPSVAVGPQGVLRFGGWGGKRRTDETWRFDDGQWLRLYEELAPTPRNHAAMAYDAAMGSFILYGGHDGSNVFGDTWEWKDGQWELLEEGRSVPRLRNGH